MDDVFFFHSILLMRPAWLKHRPARILTSEPSVPIPPRLVANISSLLNNRPARIPTSEPSVPIPPRLVLNPALLLNNRPARIRTEVSACLHSYQRAEWLSTTLRACRLSTGENSFKYLLPFTWTVSSGVPLSSSCPPKIHAILFLFAFLHSNMCVHQSFLSYLCGWQYQLRVTYDGWWDV